MIKDIRILELLILAAGLKEGGCKSPPERNRAYDILGGGRRSAASGSAFYRLAGGRHWVERRELALVLLVGRPRSLNWASFCQDTGCSSKRDLAQMNVQWLEGDLNRNNNFDLIRLLAAIQVVIYHGIAHLHLPIPRLLLLILAAFPGVPIFFFLSGMLVTFSLASTPRRRLFYEKRFRRLYPGLVVAFVFAVALLTAFGRIGGMELQRPDFWAWVVGQLTVLQSYNSPVFRSFGIGTVNGSLWTIPIEVSFYLVLPFLAAWAKRRERFWRVIAIGSVLSFALSVYAERHGESMPIKIVQQTFLPFFYQFGLGVLAYLFLGRIRAFVKGKLFLLLALTMAFSGASNQFLFWGQPFLRFAGLVFLCLAVLAFGLETQPIAPKLLRGWDLSYGVYIFHMLVMNTFVVLGYTGDWGDLLLVLIISLFLAAVSWRLIEWPIISVRRPNRQAA